MQRGGALSDSSSDESEDEEEKKREKEREEEEERERNEPGETTKQRMFREQRLSIIRMVCEEIKKGDERTGTSSLDVFTKNGLNALMYAVRTKCFCGTDGYKVNRGSVEIVRTLMEMECDPDAMNERAETVISTIIERPPTEMMEILALVLERAGVNKELIVYESDKKKKMMSHSTLRVDIGEDDSDYDAESSSDSDSEDSDHRYRSENDEDAMPTLEDDAFIDDDGDVAVCDVGGFPNPQKRKIKCHKQSYLSMAVTRVSAGKESAKFLFSPKNRIKCKICSILISKGAKTGDSNHYPDGETVPQREAGTAANSMAFQLISLLLGCESNVRLNVVDKPKMANAKSLLRFIIEIVRYEAEQREIAMTAAIERVRSLHHGRDQRVIAHKKSLYRDRVLSIPLISTVILKKVLSTKMEALKLPSLKQLLTNNDIFEDGFKAKNECTALTVCTMMFKKGSVDLNKFENIDAKSAVNPAFDLMSLDTTLRERLLKMMIKNGLNINRQDTRYNEPLLVHAMRKYDYRSIDLLVKHGLNVNNTGWKNQYVGDALKDKPNRLDKHPVEVLVEMGAGPLPRRRLGNLGVENQNDRHRPEMLDSMLKQKGVDVLLQDSFCVTATKKDRLLCCIESENDALHNLKEVEVECMMYKCEVERQHGKEWALAKEFMCDHLAFFAYPNAYQSFNKHYKSLMEKRIVSPLWKQSAEILLNNQWSLSRARKLFKSCKNKLVTAILNENEKRKRIRENYKKQETKDVHCANP